jgi:cathepsin L
MSSRAIVIALVLLAACVAARPKWHQLSAGYTFDQYTKDFRKMYTPVEYAMRKSIFDEKLAHILEFNANSGASYKKGINHLTDMTTAELLRMNGRVPNSQVQQPEPSAVFVAEGIPVPAFIDYRNTSVTNKTRVLTAVKDQGYCGSCWAHAATESIESHYALATGELFVLSQQQITSCTENSQKCGGSGGCFGATAQIGWNYAQSAGGLTEEWMYGYSSYFGASGTCNVNSNMSMFVGVNGYTQIASNNATATIEALVTKGPLAISVDASTWFEYETGVFSGCNYSNNISIDHAVQLVGYGFDATLNEHYWLVRNSWSASFGESGYIRLKREVVNETCGWNVDWIGQGGGCPNGINVTYTCGMCGILYDVAFPNVAAPPAASSPTSSSKAWIAGAVVGGVAGAAIIGAIIFKVFFSSSSGGSYGESQDLLDGKPNVPLRSV